MDVVILLLLGLAGACYYFYTRLNGQDEMLCRMYDMLEEIGKSQNSLIDVQEEFQDKFFKSIEFVSEEKENDNKKSNCD